MKDFATVLDENMGTNPPDFEGLYGANTAAEAAAARTWLLAINTAKVLWEEHQPSEVGEDGLPPSVRDEGSD